MDQFATPTHHRSYEEQAMWQELTHAITRQYDPSMPSPQQLETATGRRGQQQARNQLLGHALDGPDP